MRLNFGTAVHCSDGELGRLADVVIDPAARRLTHLIVRTDQGPGESRLVPIELAQPVDGGDVSLRCTLAEARELEAVDGFAYVRMSEPPVEDPQWDVGIEHVLAMPYYPATELEPVGAPYDDHVGIAYDRVPKGEVEVRRASAVICADRRAVGHVDGFVVDRGEQITHLVVARGHLWRRRDVTVPIGAVAKVGTDSVTLSLTGEQLDELPAVRFHRWPALTR